MINPFTDLLVWPVPLQVNTKPVITDGFSRVSRGGRGHLGVDIMYPKNVQSAARLPDESRMFRMPSMAVKAISIADGKVWSINRRDTHGISVKIDHGAPYLSVYRHLATCDLKEKQTVIQGQAIGFIGEDPTNAKDPNHLHFELWDTSRPRQTDDVRGDFSFDPQPAMELLWGYKFADGGLLKNNPSPALVAKYQSKVTGETVLSLGLAGLAAKIAIG